MKESDVPERPGIDFENVMLEYGQGDERTVALSALSFRVEPGEPVALIGPSGCGKSTALRMATGLLSPTAGKVLVGGKPVRTPRRTTAFIPQDLGLFSWKTVYQNAALGLVIRKTLPAETRARTLEALREVELADFADAYPRDLSGGMRQRLALARAIALDMDVLLMDEPLSAIDALLRETLQDALLDLWKRRSQTQMLVTHSIEEAVYLGKRILVISPRPGRLVKAIDNPRMGEPGWRDSAEFSERCREVRAALPRGMAEVRS